MKFEFSRTFNFCCQSLHLINKYLSTHYFMSTLCQIQSLQFFRNRYVEDCFAPVNKTITKREMKWWRENLNFGTRGYSFSQIFISGHRNSPFLSLLNQVFVSFTRLSLMIMTKVTPIFTYSGCHTCKLHNRHHINAGSPLV